MSLQLTTDHILAQDTAVYMYEREIIFRQKAVSLNAVSTRLPHMRYVECYPFKQPPGVAGQLTGRFERATGRTIVGSNPGAGGEFFLFSKMIRLAVGSTRRSIRLGNRGSLPGIR